MLAAKVRGRTMLHQSGRDRALWRISSLRRAGAICRNEVAHQAKRSLLNFFAVALTGCRNETFEIALGTLPHSPAAIRQL